MSDFTRAEFGSTPLGEKLVSHWEFDALVEEVDAMAGHVSTVYRYRGSVPYFDDLPSDGMSPGDVYDVGEDGMNYAWAEDSNDEGYWDPLGPSLDGYATTADTTLNRRGFSEWTIVLEGQQTDSLFMYWNGEAWAPRSRSIVGIRKGNAESLSLSWTEGDEAVRTFSARRASVNDIWEITPEGAVCGIWFDGVGWVPFIPEFGPEEFKGDANSTELSWSDPFNVTATREAIHGYVLGSQTDKPLAPAGDYALRSEVPAKTDLGYMPIEGHAVNYANSLRLSPDKFVYCGTIAFTYGTSAGSFEELSTNDIPYSDSYFKYDLELSMPSDPMASMTWPSSWVWVNTPPSVQEMNDADSANPDCIVYLSCRLCCKEPSAAGAARKTLVEFRGIGARSR